MPFIAHEWYLKSIQAAAIAKALWLHPKSHKIHTCTMYIVRVNVYFANILNTVHHLNHCLVRNSHLLQCDN